jgi:hypothetical protein
VLQALAVTSDVTGTTFTPLGAKLIAQELSHYPENSVLVALERVRRELTGRFSLAQVIERIPGEHPGVEQAWAMVAKALTDESVTLVQTHEMARAFGVALGLPDDLVAARMAFKAEYQQQVANARQKGISPEWFVSPGSDATARSGPVLEAVKEGKIPLEYASQFIPEAENNPEYLRLVEQIRPALKALPA